MRLTYLVSNIRGPQLGVEFLPPAPDAPGPAVPPSMPEPAPPVAQTPDIPPPAPVVVAPQPRWIQAGTHDLTPTLAAVGAVAVLTALGFALLK